VNDGDFHRCVLIYIGQQSAEIDTRKVTTDREKKGIDLDLIERSDQQYVYLNYRLSLSELLSRFI
jgi:hypothetical protein